MRLIDLDQTIFVPIIDESQGGVKYEVEMTVAEVFDKFFDDVQPEIVDAIPVEWLHKKREQMIDAAQNTPEQAIAYVLWLWKKEQVRLWRRSQ